jgi:hypothetical protein
MSAAPITGRALRSLSLAASTLALATALATPVHAQSSTPNSYIAPPPTVASGSVTSDYNTTATDIYTVNTPTAVLNFTPSGTPDAQGNINFQNAGTHVIYENNVGGSNFTVLNRIVPSDPTRPIAFNGDVTSQLHPAAGVTVRGGSVWFYSPGGIILGDGSAFDVGSLLLTTIDPTTSLAAPGGVTNLSLNSTGNPNGLVTVLSGATINATNANSYVAIVAPNILQRGTINVNGGAAFVAAEQASLTFDNGLFQISVPTGGGTAADPFPLQLRGTVNLDRSAGAATNSRGIYAVAIPKNTAISMIVAPDGHYGFDLAQGAIVQNGAVYLQAGGDLVVDPASTTTGAIQIIPTIANSNIAIEGSSIAATNGSFTARVAARAGGAISVDNSSSLSGAFNSIAFASDLSLLGATSAVLGAANGTISIGGNLNIQSFSANGPGTSELLATASGVIAVTGNALVRAGLPADISYNASLYTFGTGGTARLSASGGGTIAAGSFLTVEAPGSGAAGIAGSGGTAQLLINNGTVTGQGITVSAFATSLDVLGTGGQATVDVAAGLLQATQALTVDASGSSSTAAGAGGTARMIVEQGGVVRAGTQMQISASGFGGAAATAAGSGGAATGGTALLTMLDTSGPTTSLTVTGELDIQAQARGGIGGSGVNSVGGAATGGNVTVNIGAGAQLTAGFGSLSAFGYGGDAAGGGAAGMGSGGSVIADTSGTLDFALLSLSADAMGGNKTGGTGNAGDAAGGAARLRINGGSVTATRPTGNPVLLPGIVVGNSATGGAVTGGTGSGGYGVAGGAISGIGSAGISILNDATVTTARLGAFGTGLGGAGLGAGATGGEGRAATASILLQADGPLQIGTVTVRSDATGGASPGGAGGNATGGRAEWISAPSSGATTTTAISGTVAMSANATAGNGLTGGTAIASLVSLRENGVGQGTTIGGAVTLSSLATGGNATGGDAGSASGSAITVNAGRSLTMSGAVTATADAIGGFTNGAFNGGQADGGSVTLIASSGNLSIAGISTLSANARSGSSGPGAAGNATGGSIGLVANAGTLTLADSAQLSANAFGGVTTGNGGSATGGNVRIVAENDPDSGASGGAIRTAAVNVDLGANASQLQDQGRLGGAATGGTFTLLADTGAVTVGDIGVFASAGGYGGRDPSTTTMQGGTALIEARNANLTIGSADLSAVGQAVTIFNSNPPAGPGASIGGTITIRADAGRTLSVENSIYASVDAISGRSSLGIPSGTGTGGRIIVDAAGSIMMGGGLDLHASGIGGNVFGLSSGRGGVGQGGTIDIGVTGLLVAAQGIGATAGGRGGDPSSSTGGIGGDGIGGLARLRVTQGGVLQTNSINLSADGSGTFGVIGGSGIGGRTVGTQLGGAYLIADGGTITGTTYFLITANGYGGGSTGGFAGNGTGGQAWIGGMNGTVDLSAPGLVSYGRLQATGVGGTSLDANYVGGIGTGGQVLIGRSDVGANQGATSTSAGRILLGDVFVDATGQGGRGGDGALGAPGGLGGAGIGGVAEVSADAAFGVLVANAGSTLAVTVGGAGGLGGQGGDPDANGVSGATGNGGAGTGGTAFVGTTDATGNSPTTGSATFATVALDASGTGGSGTIGGAGRGGVLTFASIGAPVTAGDVALLAAGASGDTGGTGTGGTATVSVAGRANGLSRGSLTQAGTIAIDTSGTSTGGATVAGSSAFTVNGGNANVGLYAVTNGGTTPSATVSRIGATGGTLAASVLNVQATGNFALTTGAGGQITAGSAVLQASNTLTFGDGTTISNVPGAISVANDLTVIVGGDYTLGGPLGAGGVYSVTSGGAISTTAASGGRGIAFVAANGITAGAVTSNAGSIALATRSGSIATGALQAARSAVLLAPRSITTGAITTGTAAGDVALLSNISIIGSSPASALLGATGSIDPGFDFTTLATMTPQRLAGAALISGGVRTANLLVAASGGVTAGAINAGRILIDSGTSITVGNVSTPNALTLQADGAVITGALASGGDILAVSRTAQVTTGNVQAGGNVALLAKTGITTGAIAARRTNGGYVLLADAANVGAIDISAAGVAIAGPVSVGGPVSAAILRTSTTGTATFGGAIDVAQFARIAAADISLAGAVVGPDLAFSSGNIRLGANGSIGDANTQTVAFTVTGGGPAFLGGTSDGSGYTLDASELARVRSANISFNAGPSLAVRDAALSGSGAGASANITGANGAFTLASSGTISVTGNLRFANAGAGQSLVLNAGAVRLFTDTGSIGVFGTGDAVSGRLAIGANSIEAGTAQLLGNRASFAGPLGADVTTAIGAAAAQPREAGILQAGRIELAARDDIIIQNTGSAALAAGFSAGSDGLTITNRGGTTAAGGFNVLIYGRVQGTSGFLTNADTLAAVSFTSAQGTALAGYSTQSVVNGCAIVGGASCTVQTPVVTAPPVAAIVRDVIDGTLITFSRDTVLLPSFDQPAAIDLSFLQTPLVITDPVASAGNPILWESSGAMASTGPAGPATGKKQIDEDRRRRAAYGGQAR